jgi:hypothetical protein
MAAHVVPLAVKLMLENEGHYAPTDNDRGACLATDVLLVEKQWVEDRDGRNEGKSWNEIVRKTRRGVQFDSIWQRYKDKHPELFESDVDESTSSGS